MARVDRRLLVGVATLCFANLLFEVVLTRIFSTTMYYHFTFLAIALALFGLGSAGVFVYVRGDRFAVERAREDLARYAGRFAIATLVALVYVLANPIETWEGSADPTVGGGGPRFTARTLLQLLLLNGVVATPFFFAGVVVALAVTHFRDDINRIYAWDLSGAALAALAAGALLGVLGGPSLVIAIALLALVAAGCFGGFGRRSLVGAGAVALLLLLNLQTHWITIPSIKAVSADRLVFEKWNTFSRVTVEKVKDDQFDVRIDAGARTPIVPAGRASAAWKPDITSVAHALFDGGAPSVLIIGPGGGVDVANALSAGAQRVVGVDVNPIIVKDIMQGAFASQSGGLYRDPRVRIVVDDGRSFVRRSPERFDIIQGTLVDTWAATSAGAFALSENTLYTVEAFLDYFAHLSDEGVVTMTRWYSGPEMQRLVLLAAAALERRGEIRDRTRGHLVLIKKGALATLVAKRGLFTSPELDRLEDAARGAGLEIVLSPRTKGFSPLEQYVDAGAWSKLVADQELDLRPTTDDRPFFFYFMKAESTFRLKQLRGEVKLSNPAAWILLTLLCVTTILAVAFILLPLVVLRRQALAAGAGGRPRRFLILAYFTGIGLAFIVVEIALLQKLTLFLGHPSYALLVVLFSILLATAAGASLTARFPPRRLGLVVLGAGLALAAVGLVYSFALGPVLGRLVALPLWARIAVAGALTMLSGLLMGAMLPSGVRLCSVNDGALVPWGWGLNGAASVIGTVGSTLLAIHAGFSLTLAVGAALYALTAVLGFLLARNVGMAGKSTWRVEDAATAPSPGIT